MINWSLERSAQANRIDWRELAHSQSNSCENVYSERRTASELVHEPGHFSILNLVGNKLSNELSAIIIAFYLSSRLIFLTHQLKFHFSAL